jgi:hypothetical protein
MPREEAPSIDEEENRLIGRLVEWEKNVETVSFSWFIALVFYKTYVLRGSFVERLITFHHSIRSDFGQCRRR